MYTVFSLFSRVSLTCVLCIFLIDFFQYPIEWLSQGVIFSSKNKTSEEKWLDILVRMFQFMIGVVVVCVLVVYIAHRRSLARRRRESNQLIHSFNNSVLRSWNYIKNIPEEEDRTTVSECPICLEDYEDQHSVIQLKCHKNHIYHRDCLKKYLDNTRYNIGRPTCPICKQRIEFY